MPHHPLPPPGFWTLPGALRGDRPALRNDDALDGILQTLDIQASFAPFTCRAQAPNQTWQGRARPRLWGSLVWLIILASVAVACSEFDGPKPVLIGALIVASLPILKILSALYHSYTVTFSDETVEVIWFKGLKKVGTSGNSLSKTI